MSNKKLLFQEDDCAPEAREAFEREFLKRFGTTFQEFRDNAKYSPEDDDYYVVYKSTELNIQVELSTGHPYWAVYEL